MKSISKAWDWNKNTQDFWHDPAEESYFLVNRWKKKNFKYFLDLGCGLGRHSLLFADNGFQVEAYDLSREVIEQLSEKSKNEMLENIHFTHGDMRNLPYRNSTFDCLLAYHVISHTDSNGIKEIVNELYRVLKPGGEFYLSLGSKQAWSFVSAGFPKKDENTIIKIEDGPENGIPHYYTDENELYELFSNFNLIHVTHVKDIIMDKNPLNDSWHYFILGEKE